MNNNSTIQTTIVGPVSDILKQWTPAQKVQAMNSLQTAATHDPAVKKAVHSAWYSFVHNNVPTSIPPTQKSVLLRIFGILGTPFVWLAQDVYNALKVKGLVVLLIVTLGLLYVSMHAAVKMKFRHGHWKTLPRQFKDIAWDSLAYATLHRPYAI